MHLDFKPTALGTIAGIIDMLFLKDIGQAMAVAFCTSIAALLGQQLLRHVIEYIKNKINKNK